MAVRGGIGHVLFRGRHPTFSPDNRPTVIDKDLGPEVSFTFIDVIPGVVRPHEFHVFRALVCEANIWLDKNREWDVINCETVLLFFKQVRIEAMLVRVLKELVPLQSEYGNLHLAPEDTCFPLDGEGHPSVMGLRLWIHRLPEPLTDDAPYRQLKYVDFTPRLDVEDRNCRFKKLDAVLERVNREIQEGKTDPHMGEIITIETLYHPVANSEWKVEETNAVMFFPSRCVSIIRVFYFHSHTPQKSFPIIGIKDFVPKHISGGGFFKMPVFETFSSVLTRASMWISANPDKEFKNAQCLEVKMKSRLKIDSRIMSHSADRGDYIRIFRVAFTTNPNEGLEERNESLSPDTITSPLPPPVFLSSIIFTPGDEEATVQEIKRRVHDWVVHATNGEFTNDRECQQHLQLPREESTSTCHNRTKIDATSHRTQNLSANILPPVILIDSTAINNTSSPIRGPKPRLLSAETVEFFCKDFSEDEIKNETENTFKPNRIGTMNQFLFMAFRVYFDVGYFGRMEGRRISSTLMIPGQSGRRRPSLSGCHVM